MRLFAVTVAASEHIYARVVAPSSLPKTDSAGSGIGSHSWVARHPTRFPSLLTGIRRKPSPPLTWPDDALATGGGQCRTGANETETGPEPGQLVPGSSGGRRGRQAAGRVQGAGQQADGRGRAVGDQGQRLHLRTLVGQLAALAGVPVADPEVG